MEITINGGKNFMGDKYEVGQGIVGKNVHDIHDINFNQQPALEQSFI
jgi:hypothetical protein